MNLRRFQNRSCAILLFSLASQALGNDAPAHSPSWPLWNGKETVEQYARRANLPTAKTLDLGGGVKLDLVLIPAGKFIMGTPEPEPVDEAKFRRQIFTGQTLLALSGGVLLVLVSAVIVQAVRKRRRPNFSLARLLAMTVAAGGALLSGMHWRHSVQSLANAKDEYSAARVRYTAAKDDEKPAHSVTLTRPFYMGKYTVTQEQYQQVMGANPSYFKGKDNPVETVSWDDAQEFCKRSTGFQPVPVTGKMPVLRLPTEAEWEYACRAGTTSTYYSGDTVKDLDRVAWYYANSKNTTHPVGKKDANAFGLYDMHGNVWQRCQDWYGDDFYSKSPTEDPGGATQGDYRVLRGGSWLNAPGVCRSAHRGRYSPGDRSVNYGFRVVVVCASSRTP